MTRLILTLSAATIMGLSACKSNVDLPTETAAAVTEASALPPIRKALDCLPTKAAMMAAHRGTSENWDIAENSISGLKKLIEIDYKVAEIDVAGTKDGVLFTYHDGVWDETSTGKGPVAASTAADLETILLKTRSGKLTSERPPTFADMLTTAKGQLYMEVDFKSSAKYEDVIQAIRDADMADQVVLIAYNAGQAKKLEQLAPDMMRSNPTDAAQKTHGVWLGYNVGADEQASNLKAAGNYIIGRIGDPNRQPALHVLRDASDILVTDEAEKYDGIFGLSAAERVTYEACLKAS